MAASKRDVAVKRCWVFGGNAGANSGDEQLLPSVCCKAVVVIDVADVNCSLVDVAVAVAVAVAIADVVAVAVAIAVVLLLLLPLLLLLLLVM